MVEVSVSDPVLLAISVPFRHALYEIEPSRVTEIVPLAEISGAMKLTVAAPLAERLPLLDSSSTQLV